MKVMLLLVGMMLLASAPAHAATPIDYVGTWSIDRVVGSADVVSSADPRKLLRTKLSLTGTTATSLDGTCDLTSAAVQSVSNDKLEMFLWGGQRISGLDFSKHYKNAAFGRTETQVYYDDGRGCVEAVMLDHNHVLFMFRNGYLYLLHRLRP